MRSKAYQNYIVNSASGTSIMHTSPTRIKDYKLLLPPLPEQKAIAEVLSSLDDKIDLLHRQNETLEKMAETLFRKWFVEDADDSWEMIKLGVVVKTTSGGTPSRKKLEYYDNGTIDWVKSKELSGQFIIKTEEKITSDAIKNSSAKKIPKNSILIAMYGATVGEYAIIAKEMSCNQAICALIPNDNYPYTYLYSQIKSLRNEIKNMAVGSAQQNISQVLIKQLPVHSSTNKILEYDSIVSEMFKKIENNQIHIKNLEKLRDTLLPKLISGEVRVGG
jgi:type I restriction enzyme S subunit